MSNKLEFIFRDNIFVIIEFDRDIREDVDVSETGHNNFIFFYGVKDRISGVDADDEIPFIEAVVLPLVSQDFSRLSLSQQRGKETFPVQLLTVFTDRDSSVFDHRETLDVSMIRDALRVVISNDHREDQVFRKRNRVQVVRVIVSDISVIVFDTATMSEDNIINLVEDEI